MALTESIQKFAEVFARIESSKRRHMAEVEQMRRDLQRDLDAKWREILEKAQAEIASLNDEDEDEGDVEEDGDAGDDKILEDGGGEEQNNGAMDASP
jgi:Skp family chaperone for outer membrane proteins